MYAENIRDTKQEEYPVNTQATEFMKEGVRLALAGESDRAEYYLLKSYEIKPGAKILSTLGWFYGLHLGNRADGFRYFRRAAFYDSNSGDPYNECGNILFRDGRIQDSLKWFHRSLRCKNNSKKHFVLYNLAVVYSKLNRPERSLRYLNLALRYEPDFARARDLLGHIKTRMDDCTLADDHASLDK